jgi:hypothetical protein
VSFSAYYAAQRTAEFVVSICCISECPAVAVGVTTTAARPRESEPTKPALAPGGRASRASSRPLLIRIAGGCAN